MVNSLHAAIVGRSSRMSGVFLTSWILNCWAFKLFHEWLCNKSVTLGMISCPTILIGLIASTLGMLEMTCWLPVVASSSQSSITSVVFMASGASFMCVVRVFRCRCKVARLHYSGVSGLRVFRESMCGPSFSVLQCLLYRGRRLLSVLFLSRSASICILCHEP